MRVLFLEDEEAIRGFVRINLKRNGMEVTEAEDGETALALAKSAVPPFDIALLDVMLPTISGFDVCEQLRQLFPRMGIIMLTAKSQEEDKIRGLELGADDYVQKPFSPGELIARLNALKRRMLPYGEEQGADGAAGAAASASAGTAEGSEAASALAGALAGASAGETGSAPAASEAAEGHAGAARDAAGGAASVAPDAAGGGIAAPPSAGAHAAAPGFPPSSGAPADDGQAAAAAVRSDSAAASSGAAGMAPPIPPQAGEPGPAAEPAQPAFERAGAGAGAYRRPLRAGDIASGPFLLSAMERRLWKDNVEIVLTPTEWTLVKLLMEREGEGLSRDDILNAVWGRHYVGDLKIVDVNIRRIRQKIEIKPSDPKHIETLWGYGYRWNRSGDQ